MPVVTKYKSWCWWHDPEEGRTYTFCPVCANQFEKDNPNLTHGAGNDVMPSLSPDDGELVCDICGIDRT